MRGTKPSRARRAMCRRVGGLKSPICVAFYRSGTNTPSGGTRKKANVTETNTVAEADAASPLGLQSGRTKLVRRDRPWIRSRTKKKEPTW